MYIIKSTERMHSIAGLYNSYPFLEVIFMVLLKFVQSNIKLYFLVTKFSVHETYRLRMLNVTQKLMVKLKSLILLLYLLFFKHDISL
mgnify:CR=1